VTETTDGGRRTKGESPDPSSFVHRPSSWLAVAIFVLAVAVLLQRATRVGYNTDEGQHIATARYFQLVFLEGTLAGPPWEETYWTLTQPSLPRYILGAAIWLSGNPMPRLDLDHRIEEVRGPDRERYWDPATYRNERRLAEERRIERPQAGQLAAARIAMALLGAGAVLLLFLLGLALSGPVAGLVASLGLLAAPLALTLLPRAHAEAPLLFFTLLGLYLGVRAAKGNLSLDPSNLPAQPPLPEGKGVHPLPFREGGLGGRLVLLGLLAGGATGLGAASKLPAALGLVALGAFAVWSLATRAWSSAPAAGRSWRWSALAAAAGVVVFVAVNPFLWPDPVGRTRAMFEFRRQELVGQRALNADDAVPEGLVERGTLLLRRTFITEAPLAARTGLPLDAVLAAVGAGVLGWRAVRTRRRPPLRGPGLVGPEAFVLAWIATFLVGTAPNLGLDWERYYLPTVALGLILVGVGADALLGPAIGWGRNRRRPSPADPRAPSPGSASPSSAAPANPESSPAG
jgi:hypothetical protein